MYGHKLAAEQIWVLVQARPLPGLPCIDLAYRKMVRD